MSATIRFRRLLVATPTLALLALGLAWCSNASAVGGSAVGWGFNYEGQVGDGVASNNSCNCVKVPKPVKGITEATQVVAGNSHALALLANGTVMSWGGDEWGQLGNGSSGLEASPTPAPVPGLSGVIEIAAGEQHSLALLADGTVMAWGSNMDGQLGNGGIDGPECSGNCSDTPVPVPGLAGAVAISARHGLSLALLANGTVMVWGENAFGDAGEGKPTTAPCECVVSPQPVPGLAGAMAISASRHGGLAILADDTIRDWGSNEAGQLGTGAVTPETGCSCLGLVSPFGVSGARSVFGGGFFGMAVLSSGTAVAWGEDGGGQLGNGTTVTDGCFCVPSPTTISGLSAPLTLAPGEFHSLAVLSDGSVDSWGGAESGELGDGSTESVRDVPGPVTGLTGGASGVAASEFDSYALIGPSQKLTISLVGAGTGAVGGSEILCPPDCTAVFPQGRVKVLRAEAGGGSGFAGFTGPCGGTGPCQVSMAQDQAVTATFGPPKGTAITKARFGAGKRSASFTFSAPGAISGYQCRLIRPKAPHRKRGHHKRRERAKHAKARFATCADPKTYKHLSPGRYSFAVRALDILGPDATPALRQFKVSKPKRNRRR